MPKRPAFKILADRREQQPLDFTRFAVEVEPITLSAGDYGAELADGRFAPVVVERKSLADLYASVTRGRERLASEMERALDLGILRTVLVVECSYAGLQAPPARSSVSPRVVMRTLASWSVRYGLQVMPAGSRADAERWTFDVLDFACRQVADGELPGDVNPLGVEARRLREKYTHEPAGGAHAG